MKRQLCRNCYEGSKILVERRINGNASCGSCGWRGPAKDLLNIDDKFLVSAVESYKEFLNKQVDPSELNGETRETCSNCKETCEHTNEFIFGLIKKNENLNNEIKAIRDELGYKKDSYEDIKNLNRMLNESIIILRSEIKNIKDDNKRLYESESNLEKRISRIFDIISEHGAAGNIEKRTMLNNKLEEYRGGL